MHSGHDIIDSARDRYLRRTPRSSRLHYEAKRAFPGGDTRTINHFTPYPTFMAHGHGCLLTDVDGNQYIDFHNNMSATVHGHGHAALVTAAHEQYAEGSALGTPVESQVRHGEMLRRRVPSMHKIRYCNSGTEATMLAMRAARAFTGRDTVVKIDGGYHGIHDGVTVNMFAGMPDPPCPQPELPIEFPTVKVPRGVPLGTLNDVLVLPYNDLAAAEQLLAQHQRKIACLIVEPMMGAAGCIPGDIDYLRGLRRLTEESGVLLVFDECATFRLGPLQKRYGITPDLTTVSKIIGGGLPMGAFGGREDIMAQFDPSSPYPLYHASAFAGNNLSLTVGLAGLEIFDEREVARLNEMGERLIRDIPQAARDAGVKLDTTGIGSLAHLHWGEGPIANAHDALARRHDLDQLHELLHLELLNRGIYLSRRGLFSLSIAMTDQHLTQFVDAIHDVLTTIKPYIAHQFPHLLRRASNRPDDEKTALARS